MALNTRGMLWMIVNRTGLISQDRQYVIDRSDTTVDYGIDKGKVNEFIVRLIPATFVKVSLDRKHGDVSNDTVEISVERNEYFKCASKFDLHSFDDFDTSVIPVIRHYIIADKGTKK